MTGYPTDWNLATCLERVAAHRPDRDALIQGDRRLTWAELDGGADRVARGLLGLGCARQARVAQLMSNCVEYLESVLACLKASLVPVNTNYRYGPDELAYLWADADTDVVIFHGRFTEAVTRARVDPRNGVRHWVWVDDGGSDPCPDWAIPYESLRADPGAATVERSGDDLLLVYTGGTTGYPNGVMWRQDDLFGALAGQAGLPELAFAEDGGLADYEAFLTARTGRGAPRTLLCPPLMHSTALNSVLTTWLLGGAGVLLTGRSFDPAEVLDTAEAQAVTQVIIVGDVFGRPLVEEFARRPRDLSRLRHVVSAGAVCSPDTRAALAALGPKTSMIDTLGSSEAIGVGNSVTTAAGTPSRFTLGPRTRVFDDHGRDVVPGSGASGQLALRGRAPLGYHKDPDKTARTFQVIDGERWVLPGDIATVEADGTIRFLGRGSGCINTGGEKVFPEEVEQALKSHPEVMDAAVVGLPDQRYGQVVAALVHVTGVTEPAELREHVRARLAGYKVPRHLALGDSVGRAENGKLDYPAVTTRLTHLLDRETSHA